MADNETPSLPGKGGRPSKAELDAREKELADREAELAKRAEAIDAAEAQLLEGREDQDHVRVPVGGQEQHGHDSKSTRRAMGHAYRLDASKYLEEYPHAKLLWVNDIDGDVQRWIDVGAEPVPVKTKSQRHFEGITEQHETKWVRVVGGTHSNGQPFWVYLLMISPELYEEVKVQPELERQRMIHEAIYGGRDQSGGDDSPRGPKLPTYAPIVGDDERGMQQTTQTIR